MSDATPETPAAPAAGGTSPVKAVSIVLGVVLLEALTIGATVYFAGGPKQAAASVEVDHQTELNRPVEVMLVKDRFLNTQTGRSLLYDTEIYITVRNRNSNRIKAALEAIRAQVAMDIATIMRSAQPSDFQEPTLTTIRRQIQAKLEDRLETAVQYRLSAAPADGKAEAGHGESQPAAASEPPAAAEHAGSGKESSPAGMDTGKGTLVQDVLITRLIPYRAD